MINKLWQIVNIYLENRWFWKKTILTLVFFQQCFFLKKTRFLKKKTEHVFFQENTNCVLFFLPKCRFIGYNILHALKLGLLPTIA